MQGSVPSRVPEREVVRESAGAAMARAGGMLLQGLAKMLLAQGSVKIYGDSI